MARAGRGSSRPCAGSAARATARWWRTSTRRHDSTPGPGTDAAMSNGRTVAPYGGWASPFPPERLGQGRVSLVDVRWDGDSLVWIESRPEAKGRQTLVRWTAADGARDISPEGMNVRSRVHEYGGAPSLVAGDLVVVSDFATG